MRYNNLNSNSFKDLASMKEPEFDNDKMKYFEPNHEGTIIEDMARGLSMDEVLDYFGCDMDKLKDDDLSFFKYHYKRGRSLGRKTAVEKLFLQMGQKAGGQVALSYLIRFGNEWDEKPEGDKEAIGKKSFRVILD